MKIEKRKFKSGVSPIREPGTLWNFASLRLCVKRFLKTSFGSRQDAESQSNRKVGHHSLAKF
jgi:hypothetical protein